MAERWPIRVLVIDDDAQVRVVLARALGLMTAGVTAVDNGVTGLRTLEEDPFGLVITDLKMAELDGLAVAREIRTRHPGLPVVITTGYATGSDREAIEIAGWGLLAKPFNISELRQAVGRALGHHRAPNP